MTRAGEGGQCHTHVLPSSQANLPSEGAFPSERIRDEVCMPPGRVAISQAGSKGTKVQLLPESHTGVAQCVTWKPVGRPALPCSTYRSVHARNLLSPLGSAFSAIRVPSDRTRQALETNKNATVKRCSANTIPIQVQNARFGVKKLQMPSFLDSIPPICIPHP